MKPISYLGFKFFRWSDSNLYGIEIQGPSQFLETGSNFGFDHFPCESIQ